MELLNVLERYRSVFLAIAIIGTIGLSMPRTVDMLERAPGAVEASSAAGSAELGIGDCVVDPGPGRFTRTATSCETGDALEVFHAFVVVAESFPGEIELSDIAHRGCVEAFDDAFGGVDRAARPRLASATPTRTTWETAEDRQVLCLLAGSS